MRGLAAYVIVVFVGLSFLTTKAYADSDSADGTTTTSATSTETSSPTVESYKDQCVQEYQKKEPKPDYIGVGSLYQTPEEKVRLECQGQVGETFCLRDKKQEFINNCEQRHLQEHHAELEKTKKLMEEIKAEEQSKKSQSQ